MKLHFSQLTLLLSLLLTVSAMNWQAADNISQSNRTLIMNTIDNNIATYAPSNLAPFAEMISNTLNNQWNPAWNVFVFQLIDPTLDAIVYGYAFKNHWMWLNGYSYGGNTYGFVIWKDYNCHTWHTIANTDRQTSFVSTVPNYNVYVAISNVLGDSTVVISYNDIWQSIYNMATKLYTNTGNAYSIVAIQNGPGTTDTTNNMNGRFCSSGGAETFLFARLSFGDQASHRFKLIYIKMR